MRPLRLAPRDSGPYVNRAAIRIARAEFDKAIEDLDVAVAISPGDAEALNNRGAALSQKGDFARALADLDKAVRLMPDNARLRGNRGFTRFAHGDFKGAAEDFEHFASGAPDKRFAVLWRHLARARAGDADRDALERDAKALDLTSWPGPLLGFVLDQVTPEALRAQALSGDTADRRERRCEVAFYLGLDQILRGRNEAARPLIIEAADICPPNTVERAVALGERGRLPQ